MENIPDSSSPDRREFISKACAVCVGTAVVAIPAVAGLTVLLDPLRRKAANGSAVLVASLNSLPDDGQPHKFQVLATRVDAWNRTPHVPIGAVYLQRTGAAQVRALNVACPHAGCFVDYKPEQKGYHCPCHNSTFGLDGRLADAKSPSPRDLDALAVEIRNGHEIWVTFQNYRAGVKDRIPA